MAVNSSSHITNITPTKMAAGKNAFQVRWNLILGWKEKRKGIIIVKKFTSRYSDFIKRERIKMREI